MEEVKHETREMENKNIIKALAKFHEIVPDIKKLAINPYFSSTYASLDQILSAIKNPLKEAGLTFTQIPMGENELQTTLFHVESGESITGQFKLMPVKNDPQGQGSAITYARRYALVAMLGLNTEEDDDANRASGNKVEKRIVSKPKDLFAEAKNYIKSVHDVKTLSQLSGRIDENPDFTLAQKFQLKKFINAEIEAKQSK